MIGRIYKIITTESDEIYIGSSIEPLKERFRRHINNYTLNHIKTCSYYLFEKYGLEKCRIEIIKEYYIVDNNHLRVYETLWYNKFKNNVINKCIPFNPFSWYRGNKSKILEQQKQYYHDNKKSILEQHKTYREKHKEKIREYKKNYQVEHKKEISEKNKNYYQKHREQISEKGREKITCECGSELTIQHLSRHKKTKKHQFFIQNNT